MQIIANYSYFLSSMLNLSAEIQMLMTFSSSNAAKIYQLQVHTYDKMMALMN